MLKWRFNNQLASLEAMSVCNSADCLNGVEREGTSVAYKLAKLRRRENTIRKNTVWKIQLGSSFEQTILVNFYLWSLAIQAKARFSWTSIRFPDEQSPPSPTFLGYLCKRSLQGTNVFIMRSIFDRERCQYLLFQHMACVAFSSTSTKPLTFTCGDNIIRCPNKGMQLDPCVIASRARALSTLITVIR